MLYEDTLFVVEVKAGSFVYTPPFVDYEAHVKSYKSLLEKADHQCGRTSRYIKTHSCSSDKVLPLLDAKGKVKERIDFSRVADIFELSITIDNINSFAARAERMSFLNLRCGAISISLDDLMVYRDYFSNAEDFITYLKKRKKASHNKRLALWDELDHLGMYAFHDDYSDFVDSFTDGYKLIFDEYRKPIDDFYQRLGPKTAPVGQLKWFVGQAVVDEYIKSNGKPSRNDLCPCRSGKKYKRCHGR
ncbi:MAG: YecA family protein [Atopobiaceae bacterium]